MKKEKGDLVKRRPHIPQWLDGSRSADESVVGIIIDREKGADDIVIVFWPGGISWEDEDLLVLI